MKWHFSTENDFLLLPHLSKNNQKEITANFNLRNALKQQTLWKMKTKYSSYAYLSVLVEQYLVSIWQLKALPEK